MSDGEESPRIDEATLAKVKRRAMLAVYCRRAVDAAYREEFRCVGTDAFLDGASLELFTWCLNEQEDQ